MRDYIKDERQSTYLYNLGTFFRFYQVGLEACTIRVRQALLHALQVQLACSAMRQAAQVQTTASRFAAGICRGRAGGCGKCPWGRQGDCVEDRFRGGWHA